MRAHPEPIGYYTPAASVPAVQSMSGATVLFVVPDSARALYSGDHFTRVFAHTKADALKLLAAGRPRLVVIDWDEESLGAADVCAVAQASVHTSVLATTDDAACVPRILKGGCQGVLLKPFAPSLLAGRVGRVLKETERPLGQRAASIGFRAGTNRVWPDAACPKCGARGPTSFDFSSYRRMWYACLACEHTWLGPRQE